MDFILGAVAGLGLGFLLRSRVKRPKQDEGLDQIQRIARLVESSKDVIYYYQVKPEFKFKYISPSLDTYLGGGVVEAAMGNPYDCFERSHPDDVDQLHDKVTGNLDYCQPILQRWRNHEGEYLWFEEYASPVYHNDQLIAIQGIIRNIDDKVKLQEDLEFRINHDALTGIHNRHYFQKQSDSYNKKTISAGIIMCDLDNLKTTNDSFGHKQGDRLLIETAKLLASFESNEIFVSRMGGDEFAILILRKNEKEIINLIEFIQTSIDLYNQKNRTCPIGLSIGYACTSASAGRMEELMAMADARMYEAKRRKKECVHI
ncbi:GGDEF domain-containing protein [Bacillus sp. ISL-35]|uniref:sensor domain-containing diguanylate cyclase n=1 Tax=Bacillus sp. ISL-35 TaxID=2819122 RepID=UPI001BE67D04|nr:sensor domain-containing diguanylate cyclase [Bacillus sp. ISL-35]MBT2679689.1 GGDEF domain-containing protein [Bacillus sp. ISL-35]MBT2704722.1 GGDEF domain-containing protein [Chryseobacterium sp. ISL-80]